MKRITTLALALGLAASLSAQIRKETVSIYFATAAHELDAPSRLRLDSLVNAAKNWPDYELFIAAYTDDRGTEENNLDLAQRRAQSVNDHLKALQPEKTEIKAAGALALDLQKGSPEQQRAQMRRVDVQITHLTPNTLANWYQYQDQRQTQRLQIERPDEPQVLRGNKGAKISLPANALRRQDGRPIEGTVTIELREAYTALDMLNQNLSTTSGGRLLQTGGMVYIAAKDASGAALQLANNQSIGVALPQAQRLPEGMQLFVASRPGESTAAPIDWQPINTPFVEQTRSTNSSASAIFWFTPIPQRQKITPKDFTSIWPKNVLPNPQTNPIVPPPLPDHKRIAEENPRQPNETPRAYDARIQSLYDAEQRRRRTQNQENNNAQARLTAYNNYLDSLHSAFTAINKHFLAGAQALSMKSWLESERLVWRNFAPRYISDRLNILGSDIDRPQYATLAPRQRQLLDKFNALAAEIGDTKKILALLPENPTQEIEAFTHTFLKVINQAPKAADMEKIYDKHIKALVGGVSFEAHCQNFFQQQIPIFAKLNEQQLWAPVEPYLNSPYAKFVARLQAIDQEYIALSEAYYFRRIELGELPTEQINRALVSAVQLGWINCDKFLSYPAEECMQLAIDYPEDENTQFFVVATEINSLVRMKPQGRQYTTNEYNGLPKAMRVKLVGLRVQTGRVAIFLHEDQVQNIATTQVVFRETTLKEAELLLSGL